MTKVSLYHITNTSHRVPFSDHKFPKWIIFTMTENECSIDYDSTINAFHVKILGTISQQMILECYSAFRQKIEQCSNNNKFNILLNMDHQSHSFENIRLIRQLTSRPEFQNRLNASAAVFTNSPNPYINGNEGNFSTIEEAVAFLKTKNKELKNNTTEFDSSNKHPVMSTFIIVDA